MPAYPMQAMLCEAEGEVNELFEFVNNNAEAMHAYGIKQAIWIKG